MIHIKKLSPFILFLSTLFFLTLSTFSFAVVLTDTEITDKVQQNIQAVPALSGSQISVTTSNGVVKLSGDVSSDALANTATQIAQSTAGVKDVDSSALTVNGSQQPIGDALITAKIKGMFIQEKLFGSEDVAAISVSVETNNGVVSLSGEVNNTDQENNAIRIAKSVAGVKAVNSSIKVLNAGETSTSKSSS